MKFRFSMVLSETSRSKAYLQSLLREGFHPQEVLLLVVDDDSLPEQRYMKSVHISPKPMSHIEDIPIWFDNNESIIDTITKYGLKCQMINTLDVNSSEVKAAISLFTAPYVIYSGPGGVILGRELLNCGKKFIHVHPGLLPAYRGSTTVFYGMLIEGEVGCSVIILNESIDGGDVLYQKKYDLTGKQFNFDVELDPIIRSDTLIEFIKSIRSDGDIRVLKQKNEGNEFYIIHPVLKHLAILKHSRKK